MIFDVAIIGGGLAGCSAALHVCVRGASVVLLERRTCGSQASGVNYGGVRQQGRHPAELPLARRSRDLWARLPALVGSDCEFMVTGHLKLARSEAEMAGLEAASRLAGDMGLALELVPAAHIRRQFPWLGREIAGGSLCAEDGQANPRLVAPAFARAARAAGADVREETKVTSAIFTGTRFELGLASGETVRANRLINTAGAWGAVVSAWFGEPVPEDVMAPNMCVTEPAPYFLTANLGVSGGSIYVRQIPRGNVIFGAGLGTADRTLGRARPLPATTHEAAKLAIDLIPRLATVSLIRTWSGVEGCMPDSLPVLGISRTTPGLVHAFGFSGHGFQLGPAVGAVLSELALDQKTPTPLAGFEVDRFGTTAPACVQTSATSG
ncbi:MAG: hypothetical protein V7608_6032 [Hyphomicrobiales bacterium]|jgi:sarcosine oxidase subunit beta